MPRVASLVGQCPCVQGPDLLLPTDWLCASLYATERVRQKMGSDGVTRTCKSGSHLPEGDTARQPSLPVGPKDVTSAAVLAATCSHNKRVPGPAALSEML